MDAAQINELYELFEAVREGVITDEQFTRLDLLMAENKQVCKYYLEYMNMSAFLKSGRAFDKKHTALSDTNDSLCDLHLWRELAEYEKRSPEIKVMPEKVKEEIVQTVRRQKVDYKISKGSLFTLLTAAAAMILFFVFARFAPSETGIKVAVLADSMDAKWADADSLMEKGSAIFTSRKNILLREGYAKLLFDSQAQITIEGPSEFQVLAEDKINLRYGKLYTIVPSRAIGFTVTTQSAKIIDLGTEFGVQGAFDGTTELHVYKGKTTLIAGDHQDDKQAIEVAVGKAAKTQSGNHQIDDISLKETLFARDIDSSKQFIWHGEPLSLASLVSGGDGFTQGQLTNGIDPATGEVRAETVQGQGRSGMNIYREVKDRPLVDGVFVPNGARGATVISSAGHTFTFPKTDEYYYSDISSYPKVQRLDSNGNINLSIKLTADETADSSLLFIHTNAGITFNLEKIRQSLPHLEIDRFKSSCGISQGGNEINRSEFWVLIDGRCVFHHQYDRANSGVMEIDIPIAPEQKFLTLATTDGDDKIVFDWCVFDSPQLLLEKKQDIKNAGPDTEMEK